MPRKRCPNGSRKNKQGECVERSGSLPSTVVMTSSNSDGTKKVRKNRTKNNCVRSKKTQRCKRAFRTNNTSATCKMFQRTQRCRGVKNESYIEYKNFKVKKDVKSFLDKKLLSVPLQKIIDKANKDPNYEDTLQFILENPKRSENEIKKGFEAEILDLADNHVRDNGFEVITMKSVKYVLNNNSGFDVLLK